MNFKVTLFFIFHTIFQICSANLLYDYDDDDGVGFRITNGISADIRDFPYQVSLVIEGYVHRCGGGIIGERFVLTAAHCVTDKYRRFENHRFKVIAGLADLNNMRIYSAVDVVKIYILKSYHQLTSEVKDDIAVLELKEKFSFGENVGKLELPRRNQNFDYEIAKVAGYGWNWIHPISRFTGKTDKKLKYVDVRIIPNKNCVIESGVLSSVYHSHICGQAVQPSEFPRMSGVCNGDSGGPLVIGNTVIGVVSMGTTSCQESTTHSRYTRVSSYLNFIENAMMGIETANMMVLYNFGDRDIVFPDD